MAREGAALLDSGDLFPAIELDTVNHGHLRLPEHFAGSWGVLLLYRAHW
jgi:hypothetical protein